MRAFCYFYLVNFYGEVPLVLTDSYELSRSQPKNSSAAVYAQIKSDLSAAEGLLDYTYTTPEGRTTTVNRVRPNLAAVQTLKSRVHLYLKEYAQAEIEATKVINQSIYGLQPLNETFLANSKETIWALQPVNIGLNTQLAQFFTLPTDGPNSYDQPVFASKSLLDSFLPGDARRTVWLEQVTVGSDSYVYPSKYKRTYMDGSTEIQEQTIVLRVAELYLIRAEARNELGKLMEAASDVNMIRGRSRFTDGTVPNPLPNILPTISQEQFRKVILQERRTELFTEWGHRWFDLRRLDSINTVMNEEEKVKGGVWEPFKVFYPIPQHELTTNRNLVQTPGY